MFEVNLRWRLSGKTSVLKKLIVISAPSGGGKTTLCQMLLKKFPTIRLSISSTTRAPRGQEKNGEDYFFLSPNEFESQIEAGSFAEWAKVHGSYYGTSKKIVKKALDDSVPLLLEIDVQGAASFAKAFPDETLRIFVTPPSLEILEKRLRSRATDTEESIQRRLKNAKEEMDRMQEFEVCIVNHTIEQAYAELESCVRKNVFGE